MPEIWEDWVVFLQVFPVLLKRRIVFASAKYPGYSNPGLLGIFLGLWFLRLTGRTVRFLFLVSLFVKVKPDPHRNNSQRNKPKGARSSSGKGAGMLVPSPVLGEEKPFNEGATVHASFRGRHKQHCLVASCSAPTRDGTQNLVGAQDSTPIN